MASTEPSIRPVVAIVMEKKGEKIFDALEWLAAMCSHFPNKGESFDLEALDRQMVRYYGHYSNVARGKRKKQDQDRLIPSIPSILSPFSGNSPRATLEIPLCFTLRAFHLRLTGGTHNIMRSCFT